LEAVKIPVVYLDFETPEQYQRDLKTLGQLSQNPDQAAKLATYYKGKADAIAKTVSGLTSLTWPQFWAILPALLIGLFVAFQMRWRINLLSLNDETAFSLGAAPGRERTLLLVAAVIATSAVISVAGMVSWVGLIIPHIARRLFGADARYALPASMMIGAIFAVLCDDLARVLFPGEIPLGILTSLIGAAIFMALMMRQTTVQP
jgi:iron complex transport system permease protein